MSSHSIAATAAAYSSNSLVYDAMSGASVLYHNTLSGASGHGIGDDLLSALIQKAQSAGYDRLSLSVEPGNPARKLYERHGFAVVDEGDDAWTMMAELASS